MRGSAPANWPGSFFIPPCIASPAKRRNASGTASRRRRLPPRPLLDYHSHPERAQARREVITLYAQGWSKRSISQFLQVSRPTINRVDYAL